MGKIFFRLKAGYAMTEKEGTFIELKQRLKQCKDMPNCDDRGNPLVYLHFRKAEMAKIYISSTFKDLQNERQAAAKAVRRLGHQTIWMEDYAASDNPPLNKCQEDIQLCDAYIGIFAMRYGDIPDGYDKSFTHLEYEEAGKVGIPRLIFLLDEKASWRVDFVSKGKERKKIDQLRDELKKSHIVNFFKNCDELGRLVRVAVKKEFPTR